MTETNTFIPLSQANTGRIRTDCELPFDLSDKVGIDTKCAETLLQISGFKNLHISGIHDGETSQVMPQIVGMDARGSALAGKAQIKNVPTEEFDIKNDSIFNYHKQCRWNDLDVKLNLAEMKERIREKDESVRSPQAWAKEINSALRKGIVVAGLRNLLGDMKKYDTILSTYVYTTNIIASFGRSTPPSELLCFYFITTGPIWTLFDSITNGFERAGQGRRASLILGPEIDRAIVLGVVGSLNQLADTVKS